MAIALALFALFVVGMSLYGAVRPTEIAGLAKRFLSGPGIWVATGIRLVLAALLWLAAPACRTPDVFRVLAVVTLLAALAIPTIGSVRLLKLVDRLTSWPANVVRIQALVGAGFGVFLLWSLWPALD